MAKVLEEKWLPVVGYEGLLCMYLKERWNDLFLE